MQGHLKLLINHTFHSSLATEISIQQLLCRYVLSMSFDNLRIKFVYCFVNIFF